MITQPFKRLSLYKHFLASEWSTYFYIVSESPMLRNHCFWGFFLSKTKICQSSPKSVESWRRLWHFLGQSIFNSFIEFSHIGVNNSWDLLLTLIDFCFMFRNRYIFYNFNCYSLFKYFFIKTSFKGFFTMIDLILLILVLICFLLFSYQRLLLY